MSHFNDNRIRIIEFNVENLFIRLDHYDGRDLDSFTEREWQKLSASTVPNKPLASLKALAAAILDMNPDIAMLVEVGGTESLSHFNQLFLGGKYEGHLLEGNSNRGIDLGYLVKKSLPYRYDLNSYRDRSLDFLYPHERQSKESGYGHLRSARFESHKFSRDVLELRVYEELAADESDPAFILLLVHLKSPLDRNRIDPGGRDRRRAELEKLIQIYQEIQFQFPQASVLLAGDFNGAAGLPQPDVEFEALYRLTTLRDCLEVAGVAIDERFTYQQIYRDRIPQNRQIDFIFIPESIFSRVNPQETWSYRFKDQNQRTILIPRTFNEKKQLPSDHFPVVLTLNPKV